MAKLSRRQRKENLKKKVNKEKRKTPNEEGYISKKTEYCWLHRYHKVAGGYVCAKCQHFTETIEAEQALEKYFSSRTEYKVSEVKELAQKIEKVAWYTNTRGQRIEMVVGPADDIQSIIGAYVSWWVIFEINEDGSFPELSLSGRTKKIERDEELEKKPDGWLDRIEAEWIITGVSTGKSKAEDLELVLWKSQKREDVSPRCDRWYYEMADGRTHVYSVWKYWDYEFYRNPWGYRSSPWIAISYRVYGSDKKLEKVVVMERDGKRYSLVE